MSSYTYREALAMGSYVHFRDGKVAGWSVPLSAIGTGVGLVLLALLMLPGWIAALAVAIVLGCFLVAYGYDRFAARYNARVEAENRENGL